jgi:hypothetical protein
LRRWLLRPSAKSDCSYLRCRVGLAGFVQSYIFEFKDLTCNAQFNFCLLLTFTFYRPFQNLPLPPFLAPRRFTQPTRSLQTRNVFRDNFQNQTFKDQCLQATSGHKKTQLHPGYDVVFAWTRFPKILSKSHSRSGQNRVRFEVPEV